MKLMTQILFNKFFSFVSGNCTTCYQCIEGDQANVIGSYKPCNKFLENNTCNTTSYSNSCVTYKSDCKYHKLIL